MMNGLCECGCGGLTRLAPVTSRSIGWVRGQPIRFIKNHYRKPRAAANSYQQRSAVGHQHAQPNGNVLEHHIVVEAAVGRRLPPGASVHHVDGDRTNNTHGNLVVCHDEAYHKLLHYRQKVLAAGGNPDAEKVCCRCRRVLPLGDFSLMRSNKSSGRQSACKACGNEYRRAMNAKRT